MSLHSTAIISGSNLKTSSDGSVEEREEEEGKRRERIESGSAGSWETKSQEPPLAFFLGLCFTSMVEFDKG